MGSNLLARKIFSSCEMIITIIVTHILVVALGPPRFPITPPGQVIGFLKKATILQCGAVGYPTPVVKWSRSPPSPLPQGRSAVINGSLYINNTEDDDGGVYIYTVTNKHGMIIHGTFLKVESVGKLYEGVSIGFQERAHR